MWQPSYPGEPVPETLYVLVNSAAWARSGAGQLSLQASNSLGDSDEGSSSTMKIHKGLRLVQVATGGQTRVEVGEAQLSAQGSGSASPSMTSVSGVADVSYEARLDTRGVRITRGGAPGPKGANDPTLDTKYDEWVEKDGTGHGHTTYSYWEWFAHEYGSTKIHAPNRQVFTAAYSGTWGGPAQIPLMNWQWTPSSDDDTASSHKQEMPDGSLEKGSAGQWEGSATGPSQKVITFTVTDNSDGASARAQYYLTAHDQYEQLTHRVDDVFENPRRASINIVGPCTATAAFSVSGQVGLSAAANAQVAQFMAGVLSINLQATANITVNTTASAGANVPEGKYTWLELLDHYYYHRGDADEWSAAGYVGMAPYEIRQVPENELDCYGVKLRTPFVDATSPTPPG